MPTLTAEKLQSFARSLFEAGGVPADEAAIVAGSLVDANLCGHDSHGVIRIPQYLRGVREGKVQPLPDSLRFSAPPRCVVAARSPFGDG